MDCYDCLADRRTATAVCVCAQCGAGLCADHVRAGTREVHGTASPGRVTHGLAARRLLCGTCHSAEAGPS
ncbi:DUF2180 family protein [Streptomyces sp. ODS28]|uniref:DUF2180 family protein n=1 Tax=Streptomyces sp. ODS28 TaxID=3136688 RepID=UPI0031E897AD